MSCLVPLKIQSIETTRELIFGVKVSMVGGGHDLWSQSSVRCGTVLVLKTLYCGGDLPFGRGSQQMWFGPCVHLSFNLHDVST